MSKNKIFKFSNLSLSNNKVLTNIFFLIISLLVPLFSKFFSPIGIKELPNNEKLIFYIVYGGRSVVFFLSLFFANLIYRIKKNSYCFKGCSEKHKQIGFIISIVLYTCFYVFLTHNSLNALNEIAIPFIMFAIYVIFKYETDFLSIGKNAPNIKFINLLFGFLLSITIFVSLESPILFFVFFIVCNIERTRKFGLKYFLKQLLYFLLGIITIQTITLVTILGITKSYNNILSLYTSIFSNVLNYYIINIQSLNKISIYVLLSLFFLIPVFVQYPNKKNYTISLVLSNFLLHTSIVSLILQIFIPIISKGNISNTIFLCFLPILYISFLYYFIQLKDTSREAISKCLKNLIIISIIYSIIGSIVLFF